MAKYTVDKFSHPLNASAPMYVTLSGIVMLVRDEQLQNVYRPMLVTPSGMFTLTSDVQS